MTTESLHFTIQREVIRLFAQADAWFDRDASWVFAKHQGVSAATHLACLQQCAHYYLDKRVDHQEAVEDIIASQWIDLFEFHNLNTTAEESVQHLQQMRAEMRELLDRCLCTLELMKLTTLDHAQQYFNFTALLLQGHHQLNALEALEDVLPNPQLC